MYSFTGIDTLAVADTLQHAGGSDSGWILHHVMDANYVDFGPLGRLNLPQMELFGIDISITKDVFFLWVAAIILVALLFFISKRYKKSLIPKGLTNLFEIMIIFVRDEVVKPAVGKGNEAFMPYLLSLFFFILFLVAILSLGFGLLLASVVKTSGSAAELAWFIILLLQFLGGLTGEPLIDFHRRL